MPQTIGQTSPLVHPAALALWVDKLFSPSHLCGGAALSLSPCRGLQTLRELRDAESSAHIPRQAPLSTHLTRCGALSPIPNHSGGHLPLYSPPPTLGSHPQWHFPPRGVLVLEGGLSPVGQEGLTRGGSPGHRAATPLSVHGGAAAADRVREAGGGGREGRLLGPHREELRRSGGQLGLQELLDAGSDRRAQPSPSGPHQPQLLLFLWGCGVGQCWEALLLPMSCPDQGLLLKLRSQLRLFFLFLLLVISRPLRKPAQTSWMDLIRTERTHRIQGIPENCWRTTRPGFGEPGAPTVDWAETGPPWLVFLDCARPRAHACTFSGFETLVCCAGCRVG